jgi:hypothetical protein
MRLIEQLLLDFKQHGKTAIDILRIEQPAQYVCICSDIAARFALAEATGKAANDVPLVLVVKWLAEPPPMSPIDKIPHLIDLQPAETEGDDDASSPVTLSDNSE